MKNIIIICITFFAITKVETSEAQVRQKKGVGKSLPGIPVNFKQRAMAENKDYNFKGNLPPKETMEAESEEEKKQFFNRVTTFSPDNNTTIHLPPALPGKQNPLRIEAAPCVNFQGVTLNTSSPPDPNGGVGFDALMGTTNFTVRTVNKTGGLINEQQLITFFQGVGNHSFIFDPKISYDQYAHRWVFVCGASARVANSAILLAVSQTADPNGNWWIYNIDVDGTNVNWFDYPIIGINKNWITITGNMFKTGTGGAFYSRVWAFNKGQAYTGSQVNFTFWDFSQYFSISPSSNFDINEDKMWLVANDNPNSNGSGFVKIFNMTGTVNTPVLALGNTINVGSAWNGSGVEGPQAGTNIKISLGDDRIQSLVYRNGVLWYTQNFSQPAAAPTFTGVQMVALNPATGTHIETQRIVDVAGNTMCAFPALTINKDNDLCVGYNTFYTTGYASAAVSIRRGGSTSFESYVYKSGEDWYDYKIDNVNRFGDYSSAFTDPEDDKSIWVFSEYARMIPNNTPGTAYWGTWWAKICPDVCISNQTLAGSFGANYFKKYEVNNTITATMQINTGATIKLDAGSKVTLSPGFKALNGSKAQIYIEGCGGVR